MHIAHHYSKPSQPAFAGLAFKTIAIEICHADAAQCICIPAFEVPEHWSYEASEAFVRQFVCLSDVPAATTSVSEIGVPDWLLPSAPNLQALAFLPAEERYGTETSARQVFHRISGAWAYWGWKHDYFDTIDDARAFYDDCCHLMAHHIIAPVLHTGRDWAYGMAADSKRNLPPAKIERLDLADADAPSRIRQMLGQYDLAAAQATGLRQMRIYLAAILQAYAQGEDALQQAVADARDALIPEDYILRTLDAAQTGGALPLSADDVKHHPTPMVIEMSDAFLREGQTTQGRLLASVSEVIWLSGEPLVQFTDSSNAWHGSDDYQAVMPAMINLLAFVKPSGEFDCPAFEHAVRLMVIMLDMAAARSNAARPTISHCNLAAMLMAMGYAYDSEEGRATAAAVTALMSGAAYATTAELARERGAYAGFGAVRQEAMQRLRRQHEAAFGRTQYLGSVEVQPHALDYASLADTALADAVQRVWDMALIRSNEYGFSCALGCQISARAELLRVMDAQSIATAAQTRLLTLRACAGGGYEKPVPVQFAMGLKLLGYSFAQAKDVLRHLQGNASLAGCPTIDHEALRAKGFGDTELARIEEALTRVAHVKYAFDPFVVGEVFCRTQLKLSDAQMHDASFNLLEHLGFDTADIAMAERYACGAETLDDAPHLQEEDMAVFVTIHDTSLQSQMDMMAALQPFIALNDAPPVCLPAEASITDCTHWLLYGWRQGLGMLRLKRVAKKIVVPKPVLRTARATTMAEPAPEKYSHLHRAELPERRTGYTQKAIIGGQTVYLRTGEYPDGRLGEIFIDMPKQPASLRAMANQFAIAVSISLQHGVPLDAMQAAFRMNQPESSGSMLDYIFRELSVHYSAAGGEAAPQHSAQILQLNPLATPATEA